MRLPFHSSFLLISSLFLASCGESGSSDSVASPNGTKDASTSGDAKTDSSEDTNVDAPNPGDSSSDSFPWPDGAVEHEGGWDQDADWVDGGLEDASTTVHLDCEVLVVGGGLGAVAAAHEAASAGKHTCLVAPDAWLGGQLTTQGTPPDETFYTFSKTYAGVRDSIRKHYLDNYQVAPSAQGNATELGKAVFNPGSCWVSKLCHEPKVALQVIDGLLAPLEAKGTLQILRHRKPKAVLRTGVTVTGVGFTSPGNPPLAVTARVTIDASELGDVLPLAGADYRVGGESKAESGEPDAPSVAAPQCVQPISMVFALERRPEGENHQIPKPPHYDPSLYGLWGKWNKHFFAPVEGMAFWDYRRILAAKAFTSGVPHDIAIINWGASLTGEPGGNDFDQACGPDGCNLLDQSEDAQERILQRAREHALGFLYWIQTDVPRDDGSGLGYPNLKLRKDIFDTSDGLSPEPYIREARRLEAVTYIREQDARARSGGSRAEVVYDDTVGIARYYSFDLHGCAGGPTYTITQAAGHAQVPLGALIPKQLDGLLAGAKNIGTTKIANGSYRLHPAEWNIGQAAGAAAALAIDESISVRKLRQDTKLLRRLQYRLVNQRGGPIYWWEDVSRESNEWVAIQMMGASNIMLGWDHLNFFPDQTVTRAQAAALIVRAFGIPEVTQCHPSFTDVPCSDPYYRYVQALADRNVTAGVGGGLYDPNPPITRAQFATFMVRADCSPSWNEASCPLQKPATPSFSDVPTSSPYYGYIETARAKGWFIGSTGGTFLPENSLPRKHAALVLLNHMKGWAGLK